MRLEFAFRCCKCIFQVILKKDLCLFKKLCFLSKIQCIVVIVVKYCMLSVIGNMKYEIRDTDKKILIFQLDVS